MTTELPPAARAAADNGNLVEAIQLTREHSGMSLAEAKAAVEAYRAGRTAPATATGDIPLPAEAIAHLEAGQLIDAIKALRTASGLGLKDSKETVERYLGTHPATQARFHEATRVRQRAALQKLLNALLAAGLVAAALVATGLLPWPA